PLDRPRHTARPHRPPHPFPTRRSSDLVRAGGMVAPAPHPRPAHHTLTGFLERIGRIPVGLIGRVLSLLSFFGVVCIVAGRVFLQDRKSTRLNSSHRTISYAVFCLKKKN